MVARDVVIEKEGWGEMEGSALGYAKEGSWSRERCFKKALARTKEDVAP